MGVGVARASGEISKKVSRGGGEFGGTGLEMGVSCHYCVCTLETRVVTLRMILGVSCRVGSSTNKALRRC